MNSFRNSFLYSKEERPPGPRHIAEVHQLVGHKVKTIFGGAAGKFLPDELRRGADGCMPGWTDTEKAFLADFGGSVAQINVMKRRYLVRRLIAPLHSA